MPRKISDREMRMMEESAKMRAAEAKPRFYDGMTDPVYSDECATERSSTIEELQQEVHSYINVASGLLDSIESTINGPMPQCESVNQGPPFGLLSMAHSNVGGIQDITRRLQELKSQLGN